MARQHAGLLQAVMWAQVDQVLTSRVAIAATVRLVARFRKAINHPTDPHSAESLMADHLRIQEHGPADGLSTPRHLQVDEPSVIDWVEGVQDRRIPTAIIV